MDSPVLPEESSLTAENIEDISPPKDFEHCKVDTPKPPKIKSGPRNPFLTKILNMGRTGSPPERMETEDTRVTFQLEVEAIPVDDVPISDSEADEYDWEAESSSTEDDEMERLPEENLSSEYAADEEPKITSASSSTVLSIANLIKSFVFVDVGPNISDTVFEFTNLMSSVAGPRSGSIGSTLDKQ